MSHLTFSHFKVFIWFSLLLTLFSADAMACFPINIPLTDRSAAAKNIYVGYVTGSHYYQFEELAKDDVLAITELPEPYALRVLVKEVIKGSDKDTIIYPKILNCGSGKAQLKDKVIVFYNDAFWYTLVFTADNYEQLKNGG